MEEQLLTLDDYIAIIRRRKWQAIVPALILLVIAVLAAVLIPPTYRSTATILIERQEIPPDLVRTTVTSYADQRIQVISQRVMTTVNLSTLIERYDLYPDIRRRESINMAVEKMRERIKLDMISADVLDPQSGRAQEATIAFSLSFEDGSASIAQKVTNELVSLFLNENLERRTAAANEATTFLQAEAERLGAEISTLEAKLAAFKEEYSDNLPELAALNRELMRRTEERLRDNEQAIRTLQQQALYLESELAQISPSIAGAPGVQGGSIEAYLEELQARYVRVKERYSPNHPDRIQLEKEIAALRLQVGESSAAAIQTRLDGLLSELADLTKRYSNDHPSVASLRRSIADTQAKLDQARRNMGDQRARLAGANNPAYIQLRTKLDAAQIEIESLKTLRVKLEDELRAYEDRITKAPRVEQEYRVLTRDYDNAMAKYREIREKSLQAELAQSLERDRKGERFLLIEPPLVPEKPDKPNRLAILVLGFVLAGAGGVGNLALMESLDKGLHGTRAIQMATQMPLLAVVPYIETARDRQARLKRTYLLVGAVLTLVLAATALFHWLVMPLDVFWFVLMRRIDAAVPGLLN
ncbi:lipopolysaccharide biosynthesis protein [Allochromatium humboldtianum]|uniref:Lipopolysaccharide biosynthesis protein n=1 Tax=Allochromatium humboldtianum TaxID=504901 RepID=A0A850RE33_9GAMM|nr:lipopolysaccharide biosynthesis protein [Allochromatium humboldtianum]